MTEDSHDNQPNKIAEAVELGETVGGPRAKNREHARLFLRVGQRYVEFVERDVWVGWNWDCGFYREEEGRKERHGDFGPEGFAP
jgi:hypothetical protein